MPPPNITGRTRLIAHLGVPTESFASPMIYNPWLRKAGANAVVVPMGCEAEDYPEFLRLLFRLRNITGALVTMPHKTTTAGLVDEASAAVRVCGACNAVRRDDEGRLVGDMFDGEGFVRGLRAKGRRLAGASAHLVGAGGVGAAIAASLAAAGAARLSLFDTASGRAEALAARLRREFPSLALETGRNDPEGAAIVVNASPLGMSPGDPLPLDPSRIGLSSLAGDVVLSSDITPFLAAARARGCAIQTGRDMLFEQIPAYLEFFGLPSTDAAELRTLAEFEP